MKKIFAILFVIVISATLVFADHNTPVTGTATIKASIKDVQLTVNLAASGDEINLGEFAQGETKYDDADGSQGSARFTDASALFKVHGGNGWSVGCYFTFSTNSNLTLEKISVVYGTTSTPTTTWGSKLAPTAYGSTSTKSMNLSTVGDEYIKVTVNQATASDQAAYGDITMQAQLTVAYN